jgi:hypothetical protein
MARTGKIYHSPYRCNSHYALAKLFILLDVRSGGRGRDRTYDQSIKSRMLYQLSYASIGMYLLVGGVVSH